MISDPTDTSSLLTSAIANVMEDHARIAATTPADPRADAAALRLAGEDIVTLARALEVLLRPDGE